MDLIKPEQSFSKKEQKFKSRLEKVLKSQDITLQRELITKITQQLGIEPIDCAAALVVLSQSNLYATHKDKDHAPKKQLEMKEAQPATVTKPEPVFLHSIPPLKMVRYRIDVGQKHSVTEEEIKSVFVEEAGVDKKMIGIVDIRYHYTIIELPDGMPNDIYQLLTTVSVHEQKLNIKRIKHRDRYFNHSHRKN